MTEAEWLEPVITDCSEGGDVNNLLDGLANVSHCCYFLFYTNITLYLTLYITLYICVYSFKCKELLIMAWFFDL